MLLLLACAHLPSSPSETRGTAAPTPVPAPDVAVIDQDGLGTLLGNGGDGPLVVNFWATWCGPCVREMSMFRSVAADNPRARFALVSVDEPEELPRVGPLLGTLGVSLPAYQLAAPDLSLALARRLPGWQGVIPVTLVVAPGGEVTARFDGMVDEGLLRAALR